MKTKRPCRLFAASLCLGLLLLPSVLRAGIPEKPNPPRLVNDLAGIFTDAQRETLEERLVALDDTTSNQIAVVTVKDLEGDDPNHYAFLILEGWGVGGSQNNGVVLLVKPKLSETDRGQVSIQTGYGLEGAIPDVYCKRIIENEIIPHFRNNDYFGGIEAACDQLAKLAAGEIKEPRQRGSKEEAPWWFYLLFFGLLFLVFSRRSRKLRNITGTTGSDDPVRRSSSWTPPITGGWGHGSSSSFGGGFGGGFGGFGGGHGGGGGASGSW